MKFSWEQRTQPGQASTKKPRQGKEISELDGVQYRFGQITLDNTAHPRLVYKLFRAQNMLSGQQAEKYLENRQECRRRLEYNNTDIGVEGKVWEVEAERWLDGYVRNTVKNQEAAASRFFDFGEESQCNVAAQNTPT